MKRISTATSVPNKFGPGKNGFTNGNLVGGIPATDLDADWFEGMQEEVANAIEDLGIVLDGSNRFQLLGALRGRMLGVREFNLTAVYTATKGTKFIYVWIIGAGGAGAGAVPTGANAVSGGTGGGSGAYVEGILTAGFDGQLITIGAGGAPALGASGGNGGVTSMAGLIAYGGTGGSIFGPGAIPLSAASANSAAGVGGILNVPGQNGGALFIASASVGLSGVGANGMWGNGAGPSNGGDGGGGSGWGSGGSGALSFPNQGARIGGAGRQGKCIIGEFA